MPTKKSDKKTADVRFICTHCPKSIVSLGLVGYVREGPFETARYEGQCDQCFREYQLESAQIKEKP